MIYFDVPESLQIGLQDSATYGMEMIIQLHDYVMFLNTIIVGVVIWFFIEFIVTYRLTSRLIFKILGSRQNWHKLVVKYDQFISGQMLHMPALEVIWTILPVIILLSIALPSLAMLYYFSLNVSPELIIKVVGHQWFWSYEYLFKTTDINLNIEFVDSFFSYESIMVSTEDLTLGAFRLLEVDKPLFIPVNVPVRILVTSDDVLHSWAIPSLGVKIDAVPGRLNQVEFKIARAGVFYGQCSEICGVLHGFMPICIVAVPLSVFNFIFV